MHGGRRSHLKPVTPMRGPNRPKQAHSHPQRRRGFHLPHQPRPQRRHRFHHQPKNATPDANARRLTPTHETHNTNTRRLTPTHETHSTIARLQPPKTGPVTPAKAIPVSPPTPPTPAKATPVSRTAKEHNPHHHRKAPTPITASYPQARCSTPDIHKGTIPAFHLAPAERSSINQTHIRSYKWWCPIVT